MLQCSKIKLKFVRKNKDFVVFLHLRISPYRELYLLRKNRTIDWNRREAERANMRRLVKRLLKKYKYPPEEAEDAMKVVLKQCEQWAENQDDLVA